MDTSGLSNDASAKRRPLPGSARQRSDLPPASVSQETIPPHSVDSSPAGSSARGGPLPEQLGRYRILRRLGNGAMGTVYLAEDSQLQRQVAFKVPSFEQDETGELLERFYREARSAALLRNPNICPVYDVGEIEGRHYISMAYIHGQPLSVYVKADKPQTERQVLIVIRKLALALQEAHDRGIIHRDLKPGNVMVDEKGEPIVMDFGLARKVQREEAARLTQSGMIVGSPAYMSPEQVEGDPDRLTPATDQYSLGIILYELLTGQLPFRGGVTAVISAILTKQPTPPGQFRAGLDPRIEAVCLKMLAKSPSDRFPTMKAVADAVTAILKEPAPTASAAAAKPQASKTAKQAKAADQAAAGSITASNVASLYEAAQKCMRRHDYEQVVQVLETVPEAKRTGQVAALLAKAQQLADEVQFLLVGIDEALRLNDNEALARNADELLKLKPKHHKALEIKEQLSRYGKGQAWKLGGHMADGRRVGEGSWIPWLGIVVGIVVFGLTLWGVTLYLKVGEAVVRVQINDPEIQVGLQGRTLTVTSAREQIKVDPGENTLRITYGDLEFESAKFTLNKGNNPAVVVERLDDTLAAKFGDEALGEWPIEKRPAAPAKPPAAAIAAAEPPAGESASPPPAAERATPPRDAVEFQGHSYKFFGEKLSWKEAKQRCEQMGGHLPIVETAAENNFLTQLAEQGFPAAGRTGMEAVWLGATDEVKEGEWRWIDGTRLSYTNWFQNQPNNKGGAENFAILWLSSDPKRASGQWADQPNVSTQHVAHFICEWDSRGASAAGGTTKPAASGWTDLFNGRDLTGWTPEGDASAWSVAGGVLTAAPGTARPGWIATDREFSDFELQLEYRLPANGNSGVFLRIPEQGQSSGGDFLEIQLMDDNAPGAAQSWQKTGAVYAVQGPTQSANVAVNQWHQMTIRAAGPQITVSLNGREINRVNVETSPVLGPPKPELKRRSGRIALQRHTSQVEFRNIRVREITEAPQPAAVAAPAPTIAFPRNEWVDLDPEVRTSPWNWGPPRGGGPSRTWQNGVLSLNNGAVAFNAVQAKNLSFRAKMRFIDGNHIALVIRGEHGKSGIRALVDRLDDGRMYVAIGNTRTSKVLPRRDDYVQFMVTAVGNEVTVSVDGQTVLTHTERNILRSGHVEATAVDSRGMFTNLQVKVLD